MKICGIICEYNPFHNGHAYHIRRARQLSGADFIVCVMSGNFVQRGETAIFDKYTRAKHAILAGADAVIELPVHFATSTAEIFASGAIKMLNSIPSFTHLCFGAETENAQDFLSYAKILNEEPETASSQIKALTASGMSFAKARAKAYSEYIPDSFLTKPNNILGVEYTRALLKINSKVEIIPIQRQGAGYLDKELSENFSSATAIRAAIKEKRLTGIEDNLPDFVANDLSKACLISLDTLEKYAILATPKAELAATLDCEEGLENSFKSVSEKNQQPLTCALTNARYTASRIRRIALQNLLKIRKEDIRSALEKDLFLSLLAIKNKNDILLSELGKSTYPLLVKNGDYKKLTSTAKKIFQGQTFADNVYSLIANVPKETHSCFIK